MAPRSTRPVVLALLCSIAPFAGGEPSEPPDSCEAFNPLLVDSMYGIGEVAIEVAEACGPEGDPMLCQMAVELARREVVADTERLVRAIGGAALRGCRLYVRVVPGVS